jgi:transcriptional regulator with PAS, ATPase and Fis domain
MLGYVLLCSSTLALLATAAQLYVEYRRDVSNLYNSINLVEETYLAPISDSVYKIDTEHLQLQLKGLLNLTDIVHLAVKEKRGDRIIETSVGNPTAENLIHRELPLTFSDASGQIRTIGSLTITASLDGVYRRLYSRIFTTLATNAVKAFLASAGILAIIYWLIARHLTQISGYIRALQPGKQETRLALKRKATPPSRTDELDQVVMSINALQDRLNKDIARRKQHEEFLTKAYKEIDQLKNQLEAEAAYLQAEIKLEHNFESIVGNSAALKYVLYKVEQVAAEDTTVLVLGETGTGKELIARAVHNNSPRRVRPLVKVNCAALPADLIESELFGHEPGAFTGARNRQLGRFEVADGSTIFMDEIGELPLELQTKLLQVLEHGEFERLGSSRTIKVDVRVIAATNRDLDEEVRKGRFRADLFYRLNVFPITVPPLRQRAEDIPLLTRFFVEKASKRMGKSIEQISKRTERMLKNYSWPGNVRELENVIERAVINSSGSKLRLADDLAGLTGGPTSTALKSLREIEKDHILRVLRRTDWRIDGAKGAAVILDLNPSTLRSRMRKLGINKP